MKKQLWALLILLGWFSIPSQSQTLRYTGGVTEAGIYTLSASQAKQLGFQNLDEVAIYGYPGMLPQKLAPAQLSIQEIPAWQTAEQLYFFLEGPHSVQFSEQGEMQYNHHLYTDTLRYLVARKTSPKRLQPQAGALEAAIEDPTWYRILAWKEEKINLLNSGRSWYSSPIRQGQGLNLFYADTGTPSIAPWLIQARLMSQSTGPSTLRVLRGNELLEEVNFSPLPESTYSIKGNEQTSSKTFVPNGGKLDPLRFVYQGSGSGYLDHALLGVPYSTTGLGEGVYFGTKRGTISLPPLLQTWEVSDFFAPLVYSSGKAAIGKKWVIFSPKNAKQVLDLRAAYPSSSFTNSPELLIVTVPLFKTIAEQLQTFKSLQGISSRVVYTSEIFDRFGYGNPDLSAIRNYIASVYHSEKGLKNVLLIGKGTFDYKKKLGGRPNLLPIYTSRSSLDPLTTYSSDDYFALLEWGQGDWEEGKEGDTPLSIGIGRIPAITYAEAQSWLEKVKSYGFSKENAPQPLLTFLADDGDNATHMRDSEVYAAYLQKNYPLIRSQKLYLDHFEQEKKAGKQGSIALRTALEHSLSQGTLLLNYVGHGNETTLAAEEIFRVQDLENWPDQSTLPLWFTATCEFGRHDSPFIRSAAEELLFAKKKGAIGLLSTGRPVFSSVNFQINHAFIQAVGQASLTGQADLGELYKKTKNNSLNGVYNRNFSLLGDPSMRLGLPEASLRIEKLVELESLEQVDSASTLVPLQLTATVLDASTQAFLPTFGGKFLLEIWDAPSTSTTKGDENPAFEFSEENQLLFSGEGEVKEGEITSRFLLPELRGTSQRLLRFRLYAWDQDRKIQAAGLLQLAVATEKKSSIKDTSGPSIIGKIDGKDPKDAEPLPSAQAEILLSFEDPSGINSSSLLPEETLRIQLNRGPVQEIYPQYRAKDGGFEKGQAKILVTGLIEGKNEVQVSAWDNLGNMGTYTFPLEVKNSRNLLLVSHQVFPNPASEKCTFAFRHNRPNENLVATLSVSSSQGQILFSEEKRFVRAAENLTGWDWIFLQSKTKYPAKGTYIYTLTVRAETSGEVESVSGKLVIQ